MASNLRNHPRTVTQHRPSSDVSRRSRDRHLDCALSDSLSVAIQRQVADTARPANVTEHEWHHVQSLYRAASYAPLWTNGTDLLPRAQSLILALAHADEDGLSFTAYPVAPWIRRSHASPA